MATKRKAVRKPRQAEPAEARALHAALDALPVGFALFDGNGKLVAWNARLATLKLFPKRLLKKGSALGAFRAYDKALSARVSRPRDIELRKGIVLRATTTRVPPGNLLVIYEDVTAQRNVETELGLSRAEATAANERQTATAEILKVVSESPTDVQPVFQAIVENAARLMAPCNCGINMLEGDAIYFRAAAGATTTPEQLERMRALFPIPFDPNQNLVSRAIAEGRVIHVDPTARDAPPQAKAVSAAIGAQSMTQVPLMKAGKGIGVITVRSEDPAFRLSERQLALIRTFADQAVIAIENARLFNETKEALERQTATAEVLQVISSSVADTAPVFDKIIRSCEKLFGVRWANVALVRDDGLIDLVHDYGRDDLEDWEIEIRKFVHTQFPRPVGDSIHGYAIAKGEVLHYPDVENGPDVPQGLRAFNAVARARFTELGRERNMNYNYAVMYAPMFWEGKGIGAIGVHRVPPAPFADKDIRLLKTFADQASIAIQNARLFNETKEALERQTATAEILKVIASSPSDVQPVFYAICRSAARLFGCRAGINIREGEQIKLKALALPGSSSEMTDMQGIAVPGTVDDTVRAYTQRLIETAGRIYPLPYEPERNFIARAIGTGKIVTILDTEAPEIHRDVREFGRVAGYRATTHVPMMREGIGIGTIAFVFDEPGRALDERQQALVQTFADQAVIAIENVRLFNETKEALERQTATAGILKVISESPTDVQPVLEAIAESAVGLFGSWNAAMLIREGKLIHLRAARGLDPENLAKVGKLFPIPFDPDSILSARAIADGRFIEVPDTESPDVPLAARDVARAAGHRAVAFVPLLREGQGIGVIAMTNRNPGSRFTEHQVLLLRTFANQAVIAIENVRLFNETKEALERQTATAEILKVIASSPSDVRPVFDVIVKSAVRLCGARFGRVYRYDGSIIQMVKGHGLSADGAEQVRRVFPRPAGDDTIVGRTILARRPYFVRDIERDETVPALSRQMIEALSTRSQVTTPMLREDVPIGAITMGWDEPEGFDDQKVALLQTFADQAVIAIENVRLFNETKEALERQTATAEILKVIASSPDNVQPVFYAICRSAARLVGCRVGINILEGNQIHLKALAGPAASAEMRDLQGIAVPASLGYGEPGYIEALVEAAKQVYPLSYQPERNYVARAIATGTVTSTPDTEAPEVHSAFREFARTGKYRAAANVPMTREGTGLGTIGLVFEEPGRTLDERQEALLRTFADQAVIAIENVRLFNETKEALERQTATAEILKVISESPTDVQPVFDAIAESARKLFGDAEVGITLIRGDAIELVAAAGMSEERLAALRASFPRPLDLVSTVNETVVDGRLIHYPDMLAEDVPAYTRDTVKSVGIRAMLGVPLLRERRSIGGVFLSRATPGAYTEHQIALLKTFADQAVIAIENVRLFNETKDALERQTATAEILKVIAGSPADVQPVFDAIVQGAGHLVAPCSVSISMLEGEQLHLNARYAGASTTAEVLAGTLTIYPIPFDPQRAPSARAILERRVIEIHDIDAPETPEFTRRAGHAGGFRSAAFVPMVREDKGIGTIIITHPQPGFRLSDKQLEVMRTFANQAVIAIQNTRLFNETREALERQTATAEILKVISESPTDVQPVFNAIARSAASLFDCKAGITILAGRSIELKAIADGNATDEVREARFREMQKIYPLPFDPERNLVSRAIATASPIEIADTEAPEPGLSIARDVGRAGGFRSLINVPLIREGSGIGTIALAFEQPGVRLNDRQRALVQTFADQAVIAIENVRLFRELEQRTEALTKSVGQLTALGEVSQTISSTLDLDKVLPTIVSRAVQLSGLDNGAIYEYDEDAQIFRLRAGENVRQEILELDRSEPIRIGEGAIGRAAATRQTVQVPDIASSGTRQTRGRDVLLRIGARALLAVPLLREGHILGALAVTRNTPGAFPPEVVALLETFATQSAIAIQNARLFREIEAKSRQLELASQHKSQFLASMSHELRTPLNAILGFNELIVGGIYGEVPEDMGAPLAQMQSSGKHLLGLINNVLDLAKIEANKMELALADYAVQDMVGMVRSTLQSLAADKGLELAVSVPDDLPLAHGDGGRLSQCLINLAGNAIKFTKQGSVTIGVALEDETLRFSVADTGIGIPPDKIGSLFTEFKQTDATVASEYGGTGLGLSISKKFIEMHGGRIWVESEPGKGSTFIFELPLRVTAGVSP